VTTERHILVIEDSSDDHMVVVEHGTKTIDVIGGDKRIEISMTTAVGGGGGNSIGGIPVAFGSLETGDVLSYNGSAIANRRQTDLTDGGNF
jgi:hypothetical protein